MKLDIEVENLGKLKKGTVKVRPLTLLTGENGTGKSFFTKILYSIFNVININVLHKKLLSDLNFVDIVASIYIKSIYKGGNSTDKKVIAELSKFINKTKEQIVENNKSCDTALYLLTLSKIDINFLDTFLKYLQSLKKKPRKIKSVVREIRLLQKNIENIQNIIKNPRDIYIKTLDEELKNEILENFQISNTEELITKGKKEFKIKSDIFNLSFRKGDLDFSLQEEFINEVLNFSRVIFFESPVYWKVRDALQSAKENKRNNDLTGVPKYFYDLDETLKAKSKSSSITDLLKEYHNIKNEIGGEFSFDSGNLFFIDHSGDILDKNLISLGMTNLGMVGALLKHNVIDKGSFVFFDEPETNLHPKWQVLLIKTLIKLADAGVNVIIATHSLDMLKALEVYTKNKDSGFIGVNHFIKDGKLLKFGEGRYGEATFTENLIKSREKLSKTYDELFFADLDNSNNE